MDLRGRTLTVGHSNAADTTKGAHEDLLPIPEELAPWLELAVRESRSALVFPKQDGKQQSANAALHKVLRRALARAGIVVGYDHRCRRKGCGYSENQEHANPGRCPKCNMRLWPVAIPKPVCFHHLRHSTATVLLKAGVPLATEQKILRHSDPKITASVYGHLDLEDMRAGLAKLTLGPAAVRPSTPARAALAGEGADLRSGRAESPTVNDPLQFAATLLLGRGRPKNEGPAALGNAEERRSLNLVGATGFEPATTCTPSKCATRLRYAPEPREGDS